MDIGLRVNAVVSDVPAADHMRVQGNGLCPQHAGGAMASMHEGLYKTNPISKLFIKSEVHYGILQAE